MIEGLKDKVVIVTGGGHGIGGPTALVSAAPARGWSSRTSTSPPR